MKRNFQSTSPLAQAKASLRAGFSLIELLVVIAVIGIIAAIAIPNIAGLTGGATTAKDKRNAQNIASVSSTAAAAGYPFTETTPLAALQKLIAGITDNDTPDITGDSYKLDMDENEYTDGADEYLNYTTGTGFSYVPGGVATPSPTP
ncbi:MAG: prepilin-type N-terminal cleavage/methylation domain-containing protein [Chthoniobacterales bacterium]